MASGARAVLLASVLTAPALMPGVLEHRTPYHAAADVVAKPDSAVLLTAWFHHSAAVQKSLEHATVRAEWLVEGKWTSLGQAQTDEEGKAVLAVKTPSRPCRIPVRWWYKTQEADAAVFVVEPGRNATVFDIDGTLTVSDVENWKDYGRRLLRNPRPEGPVLRPHAEEALAAAAGDSLVVYLTGRPPWMGRPTREWIAFHHLPEGVVAWMPETRDVLPSQKHVGNAKLAELKAMQAAGLTFIRAYGNAPTDIRAYEAAGIPKARTFILGKHGGEKGTVALGEAFPPDLPGSAAAPER